MSSKTLIRKAVLIFGFIFIALSSHIQALECQNQTPSQNTESKKLLLLFPSAEVDTFWKRVRYLSSLAAQSLEVDLCIHMFKEGERNRVFYVDALKAQLKKQGKPDLIIGMFWLNGEYHLLDYIEQNQIPLISFNSSLTEKQYKTMGRPGEKYKYWLAHISPDDRETGKTLANLLGHSLPKKTPGKMLALSGDRISSAGNNRAEGLMDALNNQGQFELLQLAYTNWYADDAKDKAEALLKRHKPAGINLIWAASDFIAKGAVDALDNSEMSDGNRVIVGGVDWTDEAIDLIGKRKMHVSLGGHFVDGAVAVVLGVDYLNDYDFRHELGTVITTPMVAMDRDNIEQLTPYLNTDHWTNINFKSFSKKYNSKVKSYKLSFRHLLGLPQTINIR